MGTNDESFGGAGWVWAFLIIALIFNGGNFFGGGNANISEQINSAINNQTTPAGIQQLLLSSANNNYETARLMNDQTMALMSQSNTNQINAIQGFNRLQQQIADLGYRMESCCCSIKTQMLQDRLDDAQATIVSQNAAINNANQSQYLLSQLGRFVAWNPEGTQALSAVTNTTN